MKDYHPVARFGTVGDLAVIVVLAIFGAMVGLALSLVCAYQAVNHGALDKDIVVSTSY